MDAIAKLNKICREVGVCDSSSDPRDTRLTTVQKWWDSSPKGRSYSLRKRGVTIPPLPYERLSREQQDIVYHYFSTGTVPSGGKGAIPTGPGEASSNPGTEVYVEELPKCDFCGKPAHYDGRTVMGPWAHMCEECFKKYGVGLGTGKGQRLIPRKALREAEKLRGEPEKELSVTMTAEDLETATFEDVWYPTCPYCGAETPAEPDAHAVYCAACGRRFKIVNPFFSEGEWTRLGYTPRQERQLQFLERMEPHERLGYPPTYWVDCRTCKVEREFHSVEGARSFIKNHKGHDTWLKYGGTVDSLKLASSNPGGRGAMDELRAKQIAEEAAVKASELTGSKIAEQVAKEMSGELLHQSPVSPHCERVLAEPPACYDFRGIRSYVLCRAWDIMEKEKRVRLPVGEAWAEARKVCVRE